MLDIEDDEDEDEELVLEIVREGEHDGELNIV